MNCNLVSSNTVGEYVNAAFRVALEYDPVLSSTKSGRVYVKQTYNFAT